MKNCYDEKDYASPSIHATEVKAQKLLASVSWIIASQKQVTHYANALIRFCFCYFEFVPCGTSLYAKSA